MPRIIDNIDKDLVDALRLSLDESERSDFCIGYFNLRGWKTIDDKIEKFGGENGNKCRLIVGMHVQPDEELRQSLSIFSDDNSIDNQTAIRLKRKLAAQFKQQLTYGFPTDADERGLRRLSSQLKKGKVTVKLFLRNPLHAKLYLCHLENDENTCIAYVGSSNLTFAGLKRNAELNVDLEDRESTEKLSSWFEERWNDKLCIDISEELIAIIDDSWAGDKLVLPYHIYIKMVYHLSREAISGIAEFKIPKEFENMLFEFQAAAVQIAAHHIHKRNGVLIGDVVGLGKSFIATALAKIFYDDFSWRTLILCPANLRNMWADYSDKYLPFAKIMSHAEAQNGLKDLRRYQLVLIDESHNLRNRLGKRYKAIQEYIYHNDSKVILLSATPYNLSYLDLASQLRLFIDEDVDIGIRPEKYLSKIGETEFLKRHQSPLRSIAAFEKSEEIDDWRELMRLYLVRRTRSFIKKNYAYTDQDNKQYLKFPDGTKSYFPKRIPKTIKFKINEKDPNDQYAQLYDETVVGIINKLTLPRYGLGNYINKKPAIAPDTSEKFQLDNLSKAGRRLIGFSRTNLFKRMESSGFAFIISVMGQILRNYVFIYAIDNSLDLPIGSQELHLLDTRLLDDDDDDAFVEETQGFNKTKFKEYAQEVYKLYSSKQKTRFKWVRSSLFTEKLKSELVVDADSLFEILDICGMWNPEQDEKLKTLESFIKNHHPNDKLLVFSQFADTVNYLNRELVNRGVKDIQAATGSSADPTALAHRFSPVSNEKRDTIKPKDELRVLIATDVLSEGQNLQDGFIIINYDLPWAIIRLIQRAGRVDRIGQKSEKIICYSFMPAEGVEKVINLRKRLKVRLKQNNEVLGGDGKHFEGDDYKTIKGIYNEHSGILDTEDGDDVDLASYAYQIWKNAIENNKNLEEVIKGLENVSHATKNYSSTKEKPDGVLVYVKTSTQIDALSWINADGKSISESQYEILKVAECTEDTPPLSRRDDHYKLEKRGVMHLVKEQKSVGGQLGRPSGARFRTYERLKNFAEDIAGQLWDTPELHKAIEEIYKYSLRQTATDSLNRQLKSKISDDALAELVITLSQEDRLCIIHDDGHQEEPQIICSMGLVGN